MPVTGTSLLYTFDDAGAAPRKTVQYYEMMGHRGIIADGWKAVTRHTPGVSFDDDVWELYHYEMDRSECNDLAATHPEKLNELIALWWSEAEERNVLPLDDRGLELFGARFADRTPHPTTKHYTYYPPVTPLPSQVSPAMGGRSWDLAAQIERVPGQNGVIFAVGSASAGLSVFVQNDRLVFDYNYFGAHQIVESDRAVPSGESVVGVQFRRLGRDGAATLTIDGEPSGTIAYPAIMRVISSLGASIGSDHGSQICDRYVGEFPFEGTLRRVDVQLVAAADKDTSAAEARAIMAKQ